MGQRRKIREYVVQFLYQSEMNAKLAIYREELELFFDNFKVAMDLHPLIQSDVEGVFNKIEEIDQKISSQSANWKLSRMTRVDRSILRLAFYELLYKPDVPAVVIIDEAVAIGKEFGTEHSSPFINGMLDTASRSLRTKEFETDNNSRNG